MSAISSCCCCGYAILTFREFERAAWVRCTFLHHCLNLLSYISSLVSFFLRIQTLESICQLNDTVSDATNCIFRLSFWFGMWAVWQLVSVGCIWSWVTAYRRPLPVCLLFFKEPQQTIKLETVHAESGFKEQFEDSGPEQ